MAPPAFSLRLWPQASSAKISEDRFSTAGPKFWDSSPAGSRYNFPNKKVGKTVLGEKIHMAHPAAAALSDFIEKTHAIWARESDMKTRMEQTQTLLTGLVKNPAIQDSAKNWPSTEGHKNLLLHTDETYGFIINAVVRAPNRKGSVHDHSQAWVLYGLVEGTESLERYDRLDDGSRPDYAEVKLSSVTIGQPGTVDLVPPFNIHAEQGGPTRSVAMIFRSEKLVGRILQHGYDLTTGKVTERYGPTQVEYSLA